MTKSDVVSVILPTYNRGKLIEKCIFSVLNQTYPNFELIVSDDCSQDNTGSIVQNIAMFDSRIKYYRNDQRKGLPSNRNAAISESTGKYVFFIEDDMVLEPDCVDMLVSAFICLRDKKIPVGGVAPALIIECKYEERFGILNQLLRNSNRKLSKPCKINRLTGIHYYNFNPLFKELQEVPDIHACSFYDRNALDDVGGYDDKRYRGNFLYEETDLNARIRKKGYVFYFQPNAILHHKIDFGGGCRVNVIRYIYYYILNHLKFITKNYGLRSIYMIPCFVIYIGYVGLRALLVRSFPAR